MVQVMRAMTEVSTNETFHHLSQLVKESLEDTRSFWEAAEENSKLLPLVDITGQSSTLLDNIHELNFPLLSYISVGEQEDAANQIFRSLITLHIRITLLSDVFATAGYAHGRSAIGFLQSLMNNMSPQVIADLGSLHRVGVWENIVLNLGLQSKGITLKRSSTFGRRSAHWLSMNLPGDDSSINPNELNGDINPPDSSEPMITLPNVPSKLDGRRERNSTGLKHLTHGLLSCLAPFFQGKLDEFAFLTSLLT
jgi:E3 ubiquitin-protein ligase HUWE1